MAGKKSGIVKKILIALLAVFAIMQLFRIDQDNPEVDPAKDFLTLTQAPEDITTMMRGACYDCHSHETVYPWYSNVAPVSWMVGDHVEEGREHLNFSVWGDYPADKAEHKLEECYEEVEEGHMPEDGYVAMHSEADLSKEQKDHLIAWFASVGGFQPGEHEEDEEHEEHH